MFVIHEELFILNDRIELVLMKPQCCVEIDILGNISGMAKALSQRIKDYCLAKFLCKILPSSLLSVMSLWQNDGTVLHPRVLDNGHLCCSCSSGL